MEYLLTVKEMQECDAATSQQYRVPAICLMERAALAATEEIAKRISPSHRILVIAGSGNNGGDAVAVARMLFVSGYSVELLVTGDRNRLSDQTRMQLDCTAAYDVPTRWVSENIQSFDFSAYNCIVDGMFGIGLNREIQGDWARIIQAVNESGAFVVALDVPSGIQCDDGSIMGCGVRADLTVTFGFRKVGQLLYPGASFCGQLVVRDVGITRHGFLGRTPSVYTYDETDLRERIPKRRADANKGTFGKVTVVAGSHGMAGAAYLATEAAYKTGAGFVRLVTPEANRTILQTMVPEAVMLPYQEKDPDWNAIAKALDESSVVLCGSGLGTGETALHLLELVLEHPAPHLILDADALNLLARNPELWQRVPAHTIITPHVGEMARLVGKDVPYVKTRLRQVAEEFSRERNFCCVLKDARTVVSMPGHPTFLNVRGCNGMATAGSGDTLAGILAGLLSLGMETKEAGDCGTLLHALAGEAASAQYGNYSMTSVNLLEAIPTVLRALE